MVFRGDATAVSQADAGTTNLAYYAGAIAVLTAVVAWLSFAGAAPQLAIGGVTRGVGENALRQAAFQVSSLLNSTGFATSDFAQWDIHGQLVLLFAMFIGGSAGSTGGGVKVVRWLIVLKVIRRQLAQTAHPSVVQPVRLGGHVVDEEAIRGVVASRCSTSSCSASRRCSSRWTRVASASC